MLKITYEFHLKALPPSLPQVNMGYVILKTILFSSTMEIKRIIFGLKKKVLFIIAFIYWIIYSIVMSFSYLSLYPLKIKVSYLDLKEWGARRDEKNNSTCLAISVRFSRSNWLIKLILYASSVIFLFSFSLTIWI